ncbi:MAG: sigma-54 dependent transcriptional regulator [Pirellulales bacterium]|nr:sigma-54 dependent transcriptional regulator [Pirellulales bacterium]
MAHVFLVDDEQAVCWGLAQLVRELGHTASTASSAEQAFDRLDTIAPDVIVLDVRLPGIDGISAIDRFRQRLGQVPIIVITAFGELAVAVAAVRKGAFDYLVKPFDLKVAQRAIERAIASPSAAVDQRTPPGPVTSETDDEIIGSSPGMQEVFKQVAMVAATDACVHVQGESGSGKELIARAIHRFSRRHAGPFVPVNLAALSPSLAESELFGHVKGSFTGAEVQRKGLLEQAHGGTVFFDEVADIPLNVQVKLLRVLERGEIWPVGAERPLLCDFRVVTATHQQLGAMVAEGQFRHDLYFRLRAFEILLPPLRERAGDIRDLAQHFLQRLAAKNRSACPALAPETVEELERRPWWGNARELRNALEHAMILARGGSILPEHLPPPASSPQSPNAAAELSLEQVIDRWTRQQLAIEPDACDLHERLLQTVEPPLLRAVLQRHGGQYLAASRQLGLHRVTLRRKLGPADAAAPPAPASESE